MPDEPDYNAKLYEKLYSKLAIALGMGSKTRDGGYMIGESLLSIYNPGQYLPVGLSPDTSPLDNQEISQIFDTSPMFDFTYAPSSLTVSNAYKSVLDYKLFPIADLSKSEKEKLENARKSYAALKEACDQAMYAYWDACDALDEAQASYDNKTGPAPSRRLKGAVEDAMNKWIAAGKVQQETNLAIIQQLEGRDGSAFWQELDQRWASNQGKLPSGMEFPPAVLAPSYKNWFKAEGWTKFSFNQTDMDNQKNSSALGVAGALDGKFGIFTISGSGDYTKEQKYEKIDQTQLDFTCELMRVTINRPWMNPLLFNSRAWKFDAAAPAAQYSSGGSIDNIIIPKGPFVSLPTTAILARNVKIIGKLTKTEEEMVSTAINGQASLGIGPFSITGRVSYNDRTEKIRGSIAGNTIEIADTQIIAAISQILPQLPNPDPNLPWPT
ncbi:hypothetical protein FP026_25900 [Rhizobium tropici]|uniref:Uncharacterized protein n=1 Tax=Rhizobium tropici TaxID=398 RepID=A0A5B0VRQ5_RHITR|nr:hypothetical protein [Rhizobium tropici]KAA1176998.1 hypothetical protein FP026_25900 [Rhizobium tropici]